MIRNLTEEDVSRVGVYYHNTRDILHYFQFLIGNKLPLKKIPLAGEGYGNAFFSEKMDKVMEFELPKEFRKEAMVLVQRHSGRHIRLGGIEYTNLGLDKIIGFDKLEKATKPVISTFYYPKSLHRGWLNSISSFLEEECIKHLMKNGFTHFSTNYHGVKDPRIKQVVERYHLRTGEFFPGETWLEAIRRAKQSSIQYRVRKGLV